MVSIVPVAFPPLHRIRAAIFDLDGTLLDTETESTHAINLALAHHGAAITPDIKRAIIGMRSGDWSSYVIKALNLQGKMDSLDLVRQWEQNLSARMPGVAVMPGVSEAINFFKSNGIPMAIATSSSPASVAVKRAAHPDIFSCMEHVLTSDDVCNGKPAPDIFIAAARRLGADASACIVFEDSPHGVTAACEAGMACAAIPCPTLYASTSAFDPRCLVFPSLLNAIAAIQAPTPALHPEDAKHIATIKLLRMLMKIGIKDAADSQLATAGQFVIGSLAAARSLNADDRTRVCKWVKNVLYVEQNGEAGFVCSASSISHSGANALLPGQMMNVAMTYSALSLLVTCGDDLGGIDAAGVARFISHSQTDCGAFASHKGHTEVDARFCFAAVASLYMLSHRSATRHNYFTVVDVQSLLHFIARCQAFDGGFALFEGGEAHGGSTFCCVASLWLLQRNALAQLQANRPQPLSVPLHLAPSPLLPPSINIALAQRWCCLRVCCA